MSTNITDIGEVKLIKIIDSIIFHKFSKHLLKDDAFYYRLNKESSSKTLTFNSDMFVSSTDAPKQMNFYQMGRKSIIMNISDLMVKGVMPRALMISIGLPSNLKISEFRELITGIVDQCFEMNIDYIGGDLNLTKEIIINPVVFGFKEPEKIIHRSGMNIGDSVFVSNKFGLTGVGFQILLNRAETEDDFFNYPLSIKSVLEPSVNGEMALVLSKSNLATSAIDSSDGLAKSLKDLMLANPDRGFQINLDPKWIHKEALKFSNEKEMSLEKLVFNGGEEFIHIFTIETKNYDKVSKLLNKVGIRFYDIGIVINEEKLYIKKKNQKYEISFEGFEHFA